MKTTITIGQKVNSAKLGLGIISKIITKSTGYVEVTYNNGKINKEMAFNLTDENGIFLKEKKQPTKSTKEQLDRCANEFESKLNYALQQETGRTGTTEFLKSI